MSKGFDLWNGKPRHFMAIKDWELILKNVFFSIFVVSNGIVVICCGLVQISLLVLKKRVHLRRSG